MVRRTLRLTLEYDGSGFSGWARQPDRRTVEGAISDALERLWPGSTATLAVAGRTDAGVHASQQVVSVVVVGGPPSERVGDALRSHLDPDIAVIAASEAQPGFHARFSALARRYEYRVLVRRARAPLRARRSLHHATAVDRATLDTCAALVVGDHDFGAFTPTETPGDRRRRHVVSCNWRDEGDELVLAIEADAFLHHMVRTLVGTMLETARGQRELAAFARLLEGVPREQAGVTAPAHALMLVGVRYAGDGPGGDRVRCLVTRDRGGERELLVIERSAGVACLPIGSFAPEERVDSAAYRAVSAASGVLLTSIPRPLGLQVEELGAVGERRTRAVWLDAPDGLDASWEHAGVACRFVPLSQAAAFPEARRIPQGLFMS
ncbi:MAG: tRNA pseudouridine(38-40) synthase TruA [Gaiellales bacterium]